MLVYVNVLILNSVLTTSLLSNSLNDSLMIVVFALVSVDLHDSSSIGTKSIVMVPAKKPKEQ